MRVVVLLFFVIFVKIESCFLVSKKNFFVFYIYKIEKRKDLGMPIKNLSGSLSTYLPLPQNLYHITTTERLAKIKQDKILRAMPDTLTNGKVKGVFVFDLENLLTQWTKNKHMNLARLILDYIARGKELIALRIPIKNIPEEELSKVKVRDVNKVIDWKFGEYNPKDNFDAEILGEYPQNIDKAYASQRAIEHILPNDLNVEAIEPLGTSIYDQKIKLSDIIMGFFKGHPEESIIKNNIDVLG